MDGLTPGRIVHYVLPDGRGTGEHRPAIVLRVWGSDHPSVQLAVFVDGTNDYTNLPLESGSFMPAVWKTSVEYSEEPKPGTWHWIERA